MTGGTNGEKRPGSLRADNRCFSMFYIVVRTELSLTQVSNCSSGNRGERLVSRKIQE